MAAGLAATLVHGSLVRSDGAVLKITQAQYDALVASTDARFAETMVAHFRKISPVWAGSLGLAKVRDFVARGIAEAGDFDIRIEKDVSTYLMLMQRVEPGFLKVPANAWALEILQAEGPSQDRVAALVQRFPDVPPVA